MKSVRRLETFAPEHEGAFCAYVCQALRNRLRDALRRAVRHPPGQPISLEEPAQRPVAARTRGGRPAARALRRCAAAAAGVGPRAGGRASRARAWISRTSPTSPGSRRPPPSGSPSAGLWSALRLRWAMTDSPDDPGTDRAGRRGLRRRPVDWERSRECPTAPSSSSCSAACATSPPWSARIARWSADRRGGDPPRFAADVAPSGAVRAARRRRVRVVYRGWDPRVEREVAVKLLRRDDPRGQRPARRSAAPRPHPPRQRRHHPRRGRGRRPGRDLDGVHRRPDAGRDDPRRTGR